MFCTKCSQSFNPLGQPKCPTCGTFIGFENGQEKSLRQSLPVDSKRNTPANTDTGKMDAGIRKATGLMLIAVGCFLVYKVLAFLYPTSDTLVPGSSSITLFETTGQAILGVLFGGSIIRAIYAVTIERKRDLRTFASK